MSRVTKEINKMSMAVISFCGHLVLYALVAVLLLMGAKKGYEFGYSVFYAPGMDPSPGYEKVVTLNGTESVSEVGKLLEDLGLIRDHSAFSVQALCYEYKAQEGTWVLNTSLTSKEIISALKEAPEGEES